MMRLRHSRMPEFLPSLRRDAPPDRWRVPAFFLGRGEGGERGGREGKIKAVPPRGPGSGVCTSFLVEACPWPCLQARD